MNQAIRAIIKKDMGAVVSNRRMFLTLLLVPAALAIIMPSIFIIAFTFAPEDPDIQSMLALLPPSALSGTLQGTLAGLVLNYIMPVFFLMIPIMTSSVTAATSFVGEKEKHTLETLLYCPLTVKQIFRAKVLASFALSMFVSLLSFLGMFLVLEAESLLLLDLLLPLHPRWILVLLLISPAISMIAVTLIVRGSAKAQTVEESQQAAVFLIIPVILLAIGQFTGLMLINSWILLALGAACALIAWILLKKASGKFTSEALLQ